MFQLRRVLVVVVLYVKMSNKWMNEWIKSVFVILSSLLSCVQKYYAAGRHQFRCFLCCCMRIKQKERINILSDLSAQQVPLVTARVCAAYIDFHSTVLLGSKLIQKHFLYQRNVLQKKLISLKVLSTPH